MKARIADVFESFQGEGLYVGEKQLFVRFFGCNLECVFCDTKPNRYFEYDPQELFKELKLYQDDYHSVSFTGGEPLLQKDFLKDILQLTRSAGYRNYLETNGTLPTYLEEVIDYVDIVAMDLKLPSSTGQFPCWRAHREFLKIASSKDVFIKMVISTSTDTADVIEALDVISSINPSVPIVFQPDSSESDEANDIKIEYYKRLCEERNLTCCTIPQIHKYLGLK